MSDKEQATNMISIYMNLLRIQYATDRDVEIADQIREAKAKLQALGVSVEELTIERR